MTDYIHDAALVADSASFQRAPNASITVYDADDATNAVPLVLKDLNGLPLPNPLTSSQDAFTPAFITSSAQVKLVGGGLTVVLNSFQGLREDALAAQVEAQAAKTAAIGAQAAAETAGAEAAEVAAAALAGAVEDAETAKTAAEAAAALVAAPADTAISTVINALGSATRTALNATFATVAALAGKLEKFGTKTDTSAGLFDWQNNAASGYLLHLRAGASSGAGSATVGIGTDLGTGNGLLISHKNAGKGILATGQPGSGLIAEFTSRGSGSGFWHNVQAGGGAFQVNARDGGGFPDGASTGGSTTFTSATAAFAAGDVGKAIVQLTSRGDTDPFGSIPGGTTIASVTNATTVVLSQPAAATGTNVMFNIAGRVPPLSQALIRIMDTDLLTELVKFSRGGTTFGAADASSAPVRVIAKTGQTADIFQAYDASGIKTFFIGSNGGVRNTVNALFTNAALVGAPVFEATSYSSHPSIKAGRSGAVTGDNFQAVGGGTTAQSRFNKDGVFMTKINTAPADVDLTNGEMALWFDPTPGTGGFRMKGKATDGTIIAKTL